MVYCTPIHVEGDVAIVRDEPIPKIKKYITTQYKIKLQNKKGFNMQSQKEIVKQFIGATLTKAKKKTQSINMTSKQLNKLLHYLDADESTWNDNTDEYGLYNHVQKYENANASAQIIIMPFCGDIVEVRFTVW